MSVAVEVVVVLIDFMIVALNPRKLQQAAANCGHTEDCRERPVQRWMMVW